MSYFLRKSKISFVAECCHLRSFSANFFGPKRRLTNFSLLDHVTPCSQGSVYWEILGTVFLYTLPSADQAHILTQKTLTMLQQ